FWQTTGRIPVCFGALWSADFPVRSNYKIGSRAEIYPGHLKLARCCGQECPRCGSDHRAHSFDNFVDDSVQSKPDILPQCQPRCSLWMSGQEVEILFGSKLDSHGPRVGNFLHGGIKPLIAIQEEILSRNKLCLLCIRIDLRSTDLRYSARHGGWPCSHPVSSRKCRLCSERRNGRSIGRFLCQTPQGAGPPRLTALGLGKLVPSLHGLFAQPFILLYSAQ